MKRILALWLLLNGAASAAGWTSWFNEGSVLAPDSRTVVVAAAADGSMAGAHQVQHGLDVLNSSLGLQVQSGDWSAVSQAEVVLSTSGNFDEYLSVDLRPLLVEPRAGEWQTVRVPDSAWHVSAGADPGSVNAMLLRVVSHPGSTAMVAFRDIRFSAATDVAGVISIAFDDGWEDVYQTAFPLMRERGLPGTAYVIPELIGHDRYMTQQQLYDLHGLGWDIGAHFLEPLQHLAPSARTRHLRFASEWLAASGFGTGAGYAYPNGLHPQAIEEEVAQHFTSGRTIDPQPVLLGQADRMALGAVSVYPSMTQEEIQRLLREAASDGRWIIIVFHQLSENPEFDTQFPTDRFEELLDFIVAEQLHVLTVRDAWELNERVSRCGLEAGISNFRLECE